MKILGIDPGLSGALVLIDGDGKVLAKHTVPLIDREIDLSRLYAIFQGLQMHHRIDMIYLEKVSSMPKQGVASVFKFGTVYGIMMGMIAASGIPFQLITPQRWQKAMHVGATSDDPKKRTAMIVSRLYPKEDFRASERCRIPHEGICDALLIARYGLVGEVMDLWKGTVGETWEPDLTTPEGVRKAVTILGEEFVWRMLKAKDRGEPLEYQVTNVDPVAKTISIKVSKD